MREKAVFITRFDIGRFSRNANACRKALEIGTKYDATLCVPQSCIVPDDVAALYSRVVRFRHVTDVLKMQKGGDGRMAVAMPRSLMTSSCLLFTSFDFPSLYVAWRLKRKFGCPWTLFLWDPPSLSHRDGFPPLRRAIDAAFRFFVRRCDRLVLNVHPGLLDEIGYCPREGQLELRMQDAFDGLAPVAIVERESYDFDVGVLSNWSRAKGGELVAAALRRLPGRTCLWIGDPPPRRALERASLPSDGRSRIAFTGRLPQDEAFVRLRTCRLLLVPYMPTRSLKWNYPLKLFEYLSLGRPILASDNPGNVDVAKRSAGRIALFKSGDAVDLAKQIARMADESETGHLQRRLDHA